MSARLRTSRGPPATADGLLGRGTTLRGGLIVAGGLLFVGVVVWLAPSTKAVGPFSFPHRPHLRPETEAAALREAVALQAGAARPGGGGVVDADCRVCHDYERAPDAHLSGCEQCHVGSDHLQVERRAAPSSGRRAFPHREHLRDASVTCFSCHRAQKDEDWVEFSVPDPGLGKRGSGGRGGGRNGELTCVDCHAEHVPSGGLVSQDEKTGDGRACADCHQGAASILPLRYRSDRSLAAVRPFRHRDHGGRQAACESCHGGIRESKTIWDYDPTRGTAQACAACHVADAAGTPLVGVADPARVTRVPFVAFGNFSHAAHLSPAGELKVTGEITAGCQTCHFPESDPATSRLFPGVTSLNGEPISRWAIGAYPTCLPCHADWKVEGHGVGAWACFKCHGAGTDENGKLAMARVTVSRDHVGGVRFGRHHHPGVTERGRLLADPSQPGGKTCSDCHVGRVEELESRLFGATFRHAPHLAQNPTNEDCLACHQTAAASSWSEDLARFDAHLSGAPPSGSGPAPKGCLECHVGATAAELGVEARERQVPQFDHRSHVNAEGYHPTLGGVPCVECHEEGGADTVGYTVPPDVANCTRCHSHDTAETPKYARTGPNTSTVEASRCMPCHEQVWPVGDSPQRRGVDRVHLDLLPGVQFHDRGGDCQVCHDRDAFEGQRGRYEERITSARLRGSIHDDPALAGSWFNDPAIAKPGADPRGRTCRTCHRREPRGYLRALGGGR